MCVCVWSDFLPEFAAIMRIKGWNWASICVICTFFSAASTKLWGECVLLRDYGVCGHSWWLHPPVLQRLWWSILSIGGRLYRRNVCISQQIGRVHKCALCQSTRRRMDGAYAFTVRVQEQLDKPIPAPPYRQRRNPNPPPPMYVWMVASRQNMPKCLCPDHPRRKISMYSQVWVQSYLYPDVRAFILATV